MLKEVMEVKALKGKRTKVLAFVIVFVLGGLKAAGVLDVETFALLVSILTGAGLLTAADHEKKA